MKRETHWQYEDSEPPQGDGWTLGGVTSTIRKTHDNEYHNCVAFWHRTISAVSPSELLNGWVREDPECPSAAVRNPNGKLYGLTVSIDPEWAVICAFGTGAPGSHVVVPTPILRALLVSVPE